MMNSIEAVNIYMLLLGIGMFTTGIAELIKPVKLYNSWNRWIKNRWFFLHGLFLIVLGFTLVMYKGHLSAIVFFFGCTALLSGPFILIYPEKMRQFYSAMVSDMEWEQIEKLVYCDGAMRISLGSFMIYCYINSFI
jgi:uncharacterized membrane protein HdeD (DUF308 family)